MYKITIKYEDELTMYETAAWCCFDPKNKILRYQDADEEIHECWIDNEKVTRITVDGNVLWSAV